MKLIACSELLKGVTGRRLNWRRFLASLLVAAFGFAGLPPNAWAAVLEWNGNSGAFAWNLDPNNAIWRNPSFQSVAWTNGNDATFAGGFATASVAAAIVAGTVTFENSYTLENGGGSLQANVFHTTGGFISRINAVLAGTTGFTKTGTGRLELNVTNTVSGTVSINQGGLDILAADALRNATVSVNVIGGLSFATSANFGGLAGNSAFSLAQRSLTVGFNNLDTTYSGNITGNNPVGTTTTFTKTGSGTLTRSRSAAFR